MSTSPTSRLLAVAGLLLGSSSWLASVVMFTDTLGEWFSEDRAEQARITANWTSVLLCWWLGGLVASSAIAGFTARTNRVLAASTLLVLLTPVAIAIVWLG